jgi:enamine deaminase RidA (YjgF/YER057c/UK114 family)
MPSPARENSQDPTMTNAIIPQDIAPPFARYSHAIEVPAGHRLVVCSGQLGIDPKGEVPPDVEGQTRLCFANIAAILAGAGMDLAHIVRINAYVTDRKHLAGYMKARDEFTGSPPPASTLMIVSGFARPEFVVEIEVIAAAP